MIIFDIGGRVFKVSKYWLIFNFLVFTSLTYSYDYMDGQQQTIDMRGWSDSQKRQWYEYQRKSIENMRRLEQGLQMNETRGTVMESVFGNLQNEAQQKLEKARALRAKAEENRRVGFGKLILSYEDFLTRKLVNVDMGLGSQKHRFGCYSTDASSMGFVAQGSQSGVERNIQVLAQNLGQGSQENLVINIKNGKRVLPFVLKQGTFKRYGNRKVGEIAILRQVYSKDKNNKIIGKLNRGKLQYYGCAQDQGPSNSGDYGGGGDGGGYGGGGY